MSSSVPYTIPAIIALTEAALPQGALVFWDTAMKVYEPGPGDVAPVPSGVSLQIQGVEFTEDEPGEISPLYRHEEHYNVQCCLVVWAGDDDFNSRLTEGGLMFSAITTEIANTPTLNLPIGQCRLAWTRQLSWKPMPDPRGRSACQIEFEIQCQARVNSLT